MENLKTAPGILSHSHPLQLPSDHCTLFFFNKSVLQYGMWFKTHCWLSLPGFLRLFVSGPRGPDDKDSTAQDSSCKRTMGHKPPADLLLTQQSLHSLCLVELKNSSLLHKNPIGSSLNSSLSISTLQESQATCPFDYNITLMLLCVFFFFSFLSALQKNQIWYSARFQVWLKNRGRRPSAVGMAKWQPVCWLWSSVCWYFKCLSAYVCSSIPYTSWSCFIQTTAGLPWWSVYPVAGNTPLSCLPPPHLFWKSILSRATEYWRYS